MMRIQRKKMDLRKEKRKKKKEKKRKKKVLHGQSTYF